MIYRVRYPTAHWATVVVRATTVEEAQRLGAALLEEYQGPDAGDTVVEQILPDGPSEVLIEDWS